MLGKKRRRQHVLQMDLQGSRLLLAAVALLLPEGELLVLAEVALLLPEEEGLLFGVVEEDSQQEFTPLKTCTTSSTPPNKKLVLVRQTHWGIK